MNTRKVYICVGDSQVYISVKLTTIPHGLTAAITPAVLSKYLLTLLRLRHPLNSSSLSLSGRSPTWCEEKLLDDAKLASGILIGNEGQSSY